MKRLAFAFAMAVAVAACSSEAVLAAQPYGGLGTAYGFFPYGFYQPYGVQYGQTMQRPPYFSLSPPVYYGARHARPYGLSPFASPPLVSPSDGYRGRLRSKFEDGPHTTPAPLCNPYVIESKASATDMAKGEIRTNPFVTQSTGQLAKN